MRSNTTTTKDALDVAAGLAVGFGLAGILWLLIISIFLL